MSKRTKILTLFLIAFFVVSIGAKYYKFHLDRDYFVFAAIDCDIETESCFVWDCDLDEDEDCDHTPYKYIYKHAQNIPHCNPFKEDECPELQCEEDEDSCEIISCSEDELAEDEYCYE